MLHPDDVRFAQWWVSGLYLRPYIHKDCPRDSFWGVDAQGMDRVLGWRNASRVRDVLLDAGVMETDGQYIVGKKCRGFRLTDPYLNAQYRCEILDDRHLAGRVERERERRAAIITDELHRALRDHVENRASIVPPLTIADLPLQCLADGQIFFSPSQYGRVYHGYANLPRGLRQHVRLDGEACHAVDVVNSQPWFLAQTLLQIAAGGAGNTGGRKDRKEPRGKKKVAGFMFPHSKFCLNEFAAACRSGRLYELIRDEADVVAAEWGEPHRHDRPEVKQQYYVVVYGEAHYMRKSPVGEAIYRLWPDVFDALVAWKEWAAAADPDDEKPWGAPARAMQKIESETIIDGAAFRFLQANLDAPLLTVHDSLVTTKRYVEAAEAILLDEFQRRYRQQPQTKVGRW